MTKNRLLVALLFVTAAAMADELKWVDEQIEAIKPPRVGLLGVGGADPFIFLDKNRLTKKGEIKPGENRVVRTFSSGMSGVNGAIAAPKPLPPPELTADDFTLSAVMNESVMINGKWYKKDAQVNGFTISSIEKNIVTLTKNKKVIVLSTATKNPSLKFKNK